MDESQPWNSFKIDPKKAGKDLSILIECFRVIGIVLQPFIPNASKDFRYLNINNESRGFDNLNSKNILMSDHVLNKPSPIFQDMKNKIVDSHCHLNFEDFKHDLDTVIQNAKKKMWITCYISVNLEKFGRFII